MSKQGFAGGTPLVVIKQTLLYTRVLTLKQMLAQFQRHWWMCMVTYTDEENNVLHWFCRDKSGFFIKLRERAERGGEGKRMKIDYHSTADIKWIRPFQNQLKFKTQNKIFCSKSRFGIFVVKLLLYSKCRPMRDPSNPRERVQISSVLC